MEKSETVNKIVFFIKKYCWEFSLALLCILFIFSNIGLYPLIDIDETRYVNMSKFMFLNKEYITPMLNFEPFLEKPPLYFWLNILSFKLFHNFSLFACRFSLGLVAAFGIFVQFYFSSFISKNKFFGFLSSSILLSSVWYIVFSHIAILDMHFCVFSACAIYCAIVPLFGIKEENKKYFWYLGYIFMALSILAKGFIGLALPCGVVFFTYLYQKKLKELFKPIYIIPGVIVLFLLCAPWHILMYKIHSQNWIDMYILKHHFARLLNSEGLGRKQPFLFYIPVIILGFIPWIFSFVAQIVKDIRAIKELKENKILVFSYIYALFTFLFFSSASTKLPSYILTVFPAISIITAYYIFDTIQNNKNIRSYKIANSILPVIFLIVSSSGLILSLIYKKILSQDIQNYITGALNFAVPFIIFIFIASFCIIYTLKKEQFIKTFILNVIMMFYITYIGFSCFMPYYNSFAQDELENMANYVYSIENSNLVTYGFNRKYSILNPDKKIKYITGNGLDSFVELQNYIDENKNVYIITKIKKDNIEILPYFKKIKEGKVYRIYKAK